MKQVTKDMNIREMVLMDEGIAQILMSAGMHCLGCMMSHFENLEQACAVHGIGQLRPRRRQRSCQRGDQRPWG